MNIIQQILLVKNWILNRYQSASYSQEGEDLLLNRIFESKDKGFYIDVGAHHPLRFSNTYKLYKKGWRGINIDANPGSMDAFNLIRPRDRNLEIGIGFKKEVKDFYIFDEPALNTFEKNLIKYNQSVGYKLKSVRRIKIYPLGYVINKYAKNKNIDVISIDIEGMDYEALKSMNWSKKPKVFVIEQLFVDIVELSNSKSHKLLEKMGYSLYSKTINSGIYILK